jgi:hypothetical protein
MANKRRLLQPKWTIHSGPPPDTQIPLQTNTYDCGIFVCLYAAFIDIQHPLSFSQHDIQNVRTWMAHEMTTTVAAAPYHPHTRPPDVCARTYGHCCTSKTGPREARSQRLSVAERSATEFIEILYTSTTPMHSSHSSTPHSHTLTGRTCTPSVSETPGEHLSL